MKILGITFQIIAAIIFVYMCLIISSGDIRRMEITFLWGVGFSIIGIILIVKGRKKQKLKQNNVINNEIVNNNPINVQPVMNISPMEKYFQNQIQIEERRRQFLQQQIYNLNKRKE